MVEKVASTDALVELLKNADSHYLKKAAIQMAESRSKSSDGTLREMGDLAIKMKIEYDQAQPKCGNGPDASWGFVRLHCEYDENDECIHCGDGIPF